MSKKIKAFDCVEMKRRIQEQIYEETKNLIWYGNAKRILGLTKRSPPVQSKK